jgi:hypothetical protein
MPRPSPRILLPAAALVLAVSAVVYVLTYVPSVPITMAWTWPLHLATLAVFGGVLVFVLPRRNRQPRPVGVGVMEWQRRENRRSQDMVRRIKAMVPPPVRVAVAAVMLACAVNFFWCMKLVGFASPTQANGRYSLKNHGRHIRDLTEAEYRRMQAYQVRLFSGVWVIFCLSAVVSLRYVAPRVGELVEPRDEEPAPREE